MTSAKMRLGQDNGKRRLTTTELLVLAPFVLVLLYLSAEPLVTQDGPAPLGRPAVIATTTAPVPSVPAAEVAAQPTPSVEAPAQASGAVPVVVESQATAPSAGDAIKPTFVTSAATSVLERIAPIATLTIETSEAPAVAVEPVPAAAAVIPEVVDSAKSDTVAAAIPATAQPVVTATEPVQKTNTPRFEIADASGVETLGKSVAQLLEQSGFAASKMSSIPAGSQRRTVILYRDGFEEEARRLSKLFATAPALVNNTRSRNSADTSDLRLVLGTMAAREKTVLASEGGMAKLSSGRLARTN